MNSLHIRLVGTLLGIFVLAWAAVGIYTYVRVAQARTGSIDDGLGEIARTVLLSMPSNIIHMSATSNLTLGAGASGPVERLERTIQVWSKARREIVLRSTGARVLPLKADFTDGFATVLLEGEEWRVYAISDARNEVQIQVGKPTRELLGELRTWLYYALSASALAMLVVGIALVLVVRWSLRPVVTIQSAITTRSAYDLTPICDARLPREVRPLVDSFNRLLGRVAQMLHAERRFLMEAAHELRTPLAVLLTHAQVAHRAQSLDEARPALDQIVRGVERSARLSQQLLDSARVEHRANEQVVVELAGIVAVVTRDFETMAALKSQLIQLSLEPGFVFGDVDELGILVRNVLDNALRYSGYGARVAVRCAQDESMMRFEVLDEGPGVCDIDRERIFDRFYRGAGHAEPGSGVGLALVARIAQSHGAAIETGTGIDGRGFGITILFPACQEPAVTEEHVPPNVPPSTPVRS